MIIAAVTGAVLCALRVIPVGALIGWYGALVGIGAMVWWTIDRAIAFSKLGHTRIVELSDGTFQVQECRHASWDWECIENPVWLPAKRDDGTTATFNNQLDARLFKEQFDSRNKPEPTVSRVIS